MSNTQCIYHVIINTKYRKMTIPQGKRKKLYSFMWGVIKNMNCTLIWANGIPNHIHLLVELNASLPISKFVQELKRASSVWLKDSPDFPLFEGWGREYCAFSKGQAEVATVKNYIVNQEEHHKIYSYDTEMESLLTEVNMKWIPEYHD